MAMVVVITVTFFIGALVYIVGQALRHWSEKVNEPQTAEELEALRHCVTRGQPCGGEFWVQRVAKRLGLESTLRPRGRPKEDGQP